jgi:SAM-dependent methyltransferase
MTDDLWRSGGLVEEYAHRTLAPPEVVVLVRYRDDLRGRVLELGCGAGRLTGYLAALGGDVLGTDISNEMLDYCRRAFPEAHYELRDMTRLEAYDDASFEAVVAGNNLLDVLDDGERRRLLGEIARLLVPQGLLAMSTHNRAFAASIPTPLQTVRGSGRLAALVQLRRLPRRLRNRRRLRSLERDESGYVLRNDEAHDFGLLHYYVGRDAQESQLREAGFELLECLDLQGRTVPPGAAAAESSTLHYVARRT